MPQFLDRATRTVVEQYFNKDALPQAEDDPKIGEVATEAKIALERLLDACSEAEKNTQRGRSPMVTVYYIRKQITEALGE